MSIAADQLKAVVREATGDGIAVPPASLLTVARQVQDPIRALADWDQANELFAAFENEFGFINRARATNIPLQGPEISHYASLIRWLIVELRTWHSTGTDALPVLAAALVVAQSSGSEHDLWTLLPDDIGTNRNLLDYLKRLAAAFSVEFTAVGPQPAPAWELAALEKFSEADAAGDWPAIIEGWKLFERIPFFANALQTQTIRLLYRYSPEALVEAVKDVRQIAIAMQIASILDAEQRLVISLMGGNPYIELAAVYQTVSQPRTASGLFTNAERLLSELLTKVTGDKPRWTAWMKVFNTYPVRFPQLQASLGLALAKGADRCWDAYIESIWLYPKPTAPDAGRQCVSDCLRAFRQHAASDRRKALWTAAHDRWIRWNFGLDDASEHLFRISWSDLDYALVGYVIECMDESVRDRTIETIRNDLQTIDDHWHASETDIITDWNRQLSRLQPYANAANIAHSGDDWLIENKTCWPFDPARETYLAIKYRFG